MGTTTSERDTGFRRCELCAACRECGVFNEVRNVSRHSFEDYSLRLSLDEQQALQLVLAAMKSSAIASTLETSRWARRP